MERPLDPVRKLSGRVDVKINDEVDTAHGPGRVVEIAQDRYLIALTGQVGQVWERLSSLKVRPSK